MALSLPVPRHSWLLAGGCALILALGFALFTNHVWEDYYITYRSSKNLATGHGLVFNEGDRLHTFTSPLGVLLPSVASLLAANRSDTAALWIFRLMSATAFAGALGLLWALARQLALPVMAAAVLVAFVATDGKSLDFTINGMETAFMLLFLAYALWAHFAPSERRWRHLGAAWAGLMWTRPDSFIYIGLVALAVWLFNDQNQTGADRRQLLKQFVQAGILAAAIYGPWLAFAHLYYGTIIPHTIIAKGAQGGDLSAAQRFLSNFWLLPVRIWEGWSSVEGTFLPSYWTLGGWPQWTQIVARILAIIASCAWLLPRVGFVTRVASFAYFFAAAYLGYVPYFPFPWYFPSAFLLAAVALAGLAARGLAARTSLIRAATIGAATFVLGTGIFLSWGTARQMRAQQTYIETGNRRVIGEWLHEHAKPGDTVFMEPLGYIGFFSGLKTFDWPGMSSREVVAARRLVGPEWDSLIPYLQPTWLILRVDGDQPVLARDLAASNYELVRDFSRLDDVRQLDVPGRRLLEFDATFRLYHLKNPTRHDIDGVEIAGPFASSVRQIGNTRVRLVHAPGQMIMNVPTGARILRGQFGFPPEVVDFKPTTDGARFRIFWSDGLRRIELLNRNLDPVGIAADRGLQNYELSLPTIASGRSGRLVFVTETGPTTSLDWTCWSDVQFVP